MSYENHTLLAVDVDQTTFKTELFFDETVRICEAKRFVSETELREARADVEASHGSFDTIGHLMSIGVSETDLETLTETLAANKARIDYMYPDADKLFAAADDKGWPSMSLTKGKEHTQLPKLRAGELIDRPYIVTPQQHKGELIAEWKTRDGYCTQAAAGQILTARTVTLIDDNPLSFIGLPEDCDGYLVRRRPLRPHQVVALPERVITVPDLATVARIITGL